MKQLLPKADVKMKVMKAAYYETGKIMKVMEDR